MVNSGSFKRYNICVFLAYTIIVENHLLFRGPRSFKYLNVARFFSRKYRVVLTCSINNVDYMECGILSFKSTSFASALFTVFRFVDLNISRLSACAVSFIVEIRQSSGPRLLLYLSRNGISIRSLLPSSSLTLVFDMLLFHSPLQTVSAKY